MPDAPETTESKVETPKVETPPLVTTPQTGPSFDGLTAAVDKLSALPDRFVAAYREANVPAKAVEEPKVEEPKAEEAKIEASANPDLEPVKSKSFADWWFGS